MLELMRRALRVLRREGFKGFIKKALVWVDYKTGLVSFLLLPYIRFVLRRARDVDSLMELLFSDSLVGMLFRPMQIREEIRELLRILEGLRPRRILEIGTAHGGTLLLFTRVAADDALIISVDLPGGPFGGGYPWLRSLVYKSFALGRQRVVLIRADSHDPRTLDKVKEILEGEPLDLLFIDGDHSYDGVRRDYEMYSHLVGNEGIVAFHDIVSGPQELVGGVPSFWEELKQNLRGRCVKIVEIVKDWNQGGWGIGIIKMSGY